jgi:hypothetical protein
MSRQRLEAILEELTVRHWELVPAEEDADARADPFRLEKDNIVWVLRRAGGADPEIRLSFSKIKSRRWQADVDQFAWRLQDYFKEMA